MDQAIHPRGGALYRADRVELVVVVLQEHAHGEVDRGHRVLEVMSDDRDQVLAYTRRLLGRLVEEGVIDRVAGATPHVRRELEVTRSVTPARERGGGEEDGAEGTLARDHRRRDCGDRRQRPHAGHVGLVQAVTRVLDGDELGLTGSDGLGQRMTRARAERKAGTNSIQQIPPAGITMGGMGPVRGAVLPRERDDAIVRHLGHGEADGVGERLLEIQRPVE